MVTTLSIASRSASALPGILDTLSLQRMWTMMTVAAERRTLAQLDAHALADLGLAEEEVARETKRPFWDLPAGR